jgi:hypothetical protein
MVRAGLELFMLEAVFGVLAAGVPVPAWTEPSGDDDWLPEADWLADALAEADCDALAEADCDALAEADCDALAEALADAEADALAEADGELLCASVQFSEFVFEFETTVLSDSVAMTPSTPPVTSWNGVVTLRSTSNVPLPLRPPMSTTP